MLNPLLGNADNNIVVAINNCNSPFMDNAIMVITDFWFFVAVVCCIFAYAFRQMSPPGGTNILYVAFCCSGMHGLSVRKCHPTGCTATPAIQSRQPGSFHASHRRRIYRWKIWLPLLPCSQFFCNSHIYFLMVQKSMDYCCHDLLGLVGMLHKTLSRGTLPVRHNRRYSDRKSDSIYCLYEL